MKKVRKEKIVVGTFVCVCISLMLAFSISLVSADSIPSIPATEEFLGNVTINGTIAEDGTPVSAWIGGVEKDNCTTEKWKWLYGSKICNYELWVEGNENDPIQFKVYNTTVWEDTLTPTPPRTNKDLSLIDEEVNESARPVLEYTPGNDYILVNWTVNPGWDVNGISGYELFRSENNVSFLSINTTNNTKYLDTGLSAKTYYYKLRTFDVVGNGANSSVVNKTVTLPKVTLSGYVRYENGTGISGANVTLANGITNSTTTAGNGYYELMASPSVYNLTASKGDVLIGAKWLSFVENTTTVNLTGNMTTNLTLAIKGDLNGDCVIDMSDVHLAARMVIGTVAPPLDLRKADFNGNGYVDVGDAAKLLGYVRGGVDKL